jgi:hypothetical protein
MNSDLWSSSPDYQCPIGFPAHLPIRLPHIGGVNLGQRSEDQRFEYQTLPFVGVPHAVSEKRRAPQTKQSRGASTF